MELSDGAALGGVGVAKEVLQNSTPICTTAPWSWQLQGVLELGCLAGIFAGVAGVLEWSHAKQALNLEAGLLVPPCAGAAVPTHTRPTACP